LNDPEEGHETAGGYIGSGQAFSTAGNVIPLARYATLFFTNAVCGAWAGADATQPWAVIAAATTPTLPPVGPAHQYLWATEQEYYVGTAVSVGQLVANDVISANMCIPVAKRGYGPPSRRAEPASSFWPIKLVEPSVPSAPRLASVGHDAESAAVEPLLAVKGSDAVVSWVQP
jgi:hypothetical protein